MDVGQSKGCIYIAQGPLGQVGRCIVSLYYGSIDLFDLPVRHMVFFFWQYCIDHATLKKKKDGHVGFHSEIN